MPFGLKRRTVVWLAVTFSTRPEPEQTLLAFYRRARPSLAGWKPIANLAPDVTPSHDAVENLVCWAGGCMLIYGALFGTGKLILHEPAPALALLTMAAVGLALIYRNLSKRGWSAVVD